MNLMWPFSLRFILQVFTIALLLHNSYTKCKRQHKQRRRRRKKKASETNVSSKKRKLSEGQAEMLEKSFGFDQKLESDRKDRLAAELGLDPKQVAVWFQNRRARSKSKKIEEEYSKLRSQHDALLLHNCRLQTKLLELKEELNESQKEVQRLTSTETLMRCHNNSPTPSSSLTMDTNTAVDPPPLLQMHAAAGDFNFHAAAFHFQDQDAFYNIPAFGFDLWTME